MFVGFIALAAPSAKDLNVITLFGDNMLLQRNIKVPIWGTAQPGGVVEIKFNGQTKEAKVGEDGEWTVYLDPMKAGGPYDMTISGEKNLKFKNILIGDVWICSGQSNMAMTVQSSKDAKKEIKEADYPEIRFFSVVRKVSDKPLKTLGGKWVPCSSASVGGFSAAGYFFGRDLYKSLKIPIGLIHTSWGGTPAEAWTTIKTLENDEDFKPIIDRFRKTCNDEKLQEKIENFKKYRKNQYQTRKEFGDKRIKIECPWAMPDFDSKDWKEMEQPGGWQKDIKNFEGIVDFIKEIEIPSDWDGKDLTLSFGPVDEYDLVFFNGNEIGSVGRKTPDFWKVLRQYTVPGKLVKAGKAVVAVRVANEVKLGGFTGKAEQMFIEAKDGGKKISLAGAWKYKKELDLKRKWMPVGPGHPSSPAGLYNAMINPIIPYAIKGAIWYQGEANAWRAFQYRKLLAAMIKDWRTNWNQGDFPFFIVQLANYTAPPRIPGNSTWAELREAQTIVANNDPQSGLALAIDIGDEKDIHPKNKQDVGIRLALAARKITYGQDIVHAGPEYDSMKVDGNKIVINFKNVGGGLVAKGGPLKQFAIAGEDEKFKWAKAEIKGDSVVVWNDEIKEPVSVRYAWSNNPEGCNLYNKEGLPANPFRTDDWPGVTFKNR
jgi:sialate O-acetylesterase